MSDAQRPPDIPAFPRDERFSGHNGMSLRQWYAGQALVSMGEWTPLDESEDFSAPETPAFQRKAKWAFAMADAMIAEGKKQ